MSVRVILFAIVALLLIYFFSANVRDAWGVHRIATLAATDRCVDGELVIPDSQRFPTTSG